MVVDVFGSTQVQQSKVLLLDPKKPLKAWCQELKVPFSQVIGRQYEAPEPWEAQLAGIEYELLQPGCQLWAPEAGNMLYGWKDGLHGFSLRMALALALAEPDLAREAVVHAIGSMRLGLTGDDTLVSPCLRSVSNHLSVDDYPSGRDKLGVNSIIPGFRVAPMKSPIIGWLMLDPEKPLDAWRQDLKISKACWFRMIDRQFDFPEPWETQLSRITFGLLRPGYSLWAPEAENRLFAGGLHGFSLRMALALALAEPDLVKESVVHAIGSMRRWMTNDDVIVSPYLKNVNNYLHAGVHSSGRIKLIGDCVVPGFSVVV